MIKFLILGLVIIVALGGFFGFQYFGLFEKNQLSQTFEEIGSSVTEGIAAVPGQSADPVEIKYETVVEGLDVPWAVVFTAPNRMLVAERPGRIRAVQDGQLLPNPLITINEVQSSGEEGLMGLTLDPEYNQNKYVYACYAYSEGSALKDRVIRLKDTETSLTFDKTLLENIPAATFHAGCQLGFGPDGKLYVSTGDAGEKELAQDPGSLAGKILRLNSDGTIPADNPFSNSATWSVGHRNPQAFDWYPNSDVMYEAEHGPSIFDGPAGGDEVNVIEKGKNYGWPVVHHEESRAGMVDPGLVFTPAIAPGAGTFYSGDALPQFKNAFLVGMLKGEGILVVKPSSQDPKRIAGYEQLKLNYGRIRAITEGPDGFIYFTTSNQDGRGDVQAGDDKIIRISPAE